MSSLIRELPGSSEQMLAVFSDASLIRAALRFEAELARAGAAHGVVPAAAAEAIARACDGYAPDPQTLAREAAHAGTLAIPLVAGLREAVKAEAPGAAPFVHKGGTSQDLADTALALQSRTALTLIEGDAGRLSEALAGLARRHAGTPMLGRTLLQAAFPITFGLKAADWLLGVEASLDRVRRESAHALTLQLGGPVGTLSGLEGKGLAIRESLAARLGLEAPSLPWHARREGVAGLASALAILTGAVGKIARDVSLLAQGEVGEAFEGRVEGRGGSSAMAHKRNPTGCQVALTAALRAPHLAATILSGLPQEHERGLGGWQADLSVVAELFQLAHGAVAAMAAVVEGLELHPEAMTRNLDAAGVGCDTAEAQALVRRALEARNERTK
jgi:3-carboxy-cis,cis-muconate cycloisomerase